MVKKCCVFKCPSESYGGCNISFHSFPKNEEVRQKWLSNVYVRQKVTKHSVVCSRHFERSCFYTGNSRQLLKANAVPTISPVVKNERISPSLSEEYLEEYLESDASFDSSLETPVITETCSSYVEEPPRKKLCPNVKEVGVQTTIKYLSPVEDDLKRKIKVLSQKIKRRDKRIKNLQSLFLLYKKKCKMIDVGGVTKQTKHFIKSPKDSSFRLDC